MPLTIQEKITLSQTILARMAANVLVAKEYESTEDKTRFAVLSASPRLLRRFKSTP